MNISNLWQVSAIHQSREGFYPFLYKESSVLRILFGGEEPSQVMADLDIHNSYTLHNRVILYQRKIQTGLVTLSAMKKAQTQNFTDLKQRIKELEYDLNQANLLILALNTMIEVANIAASNMYAVLKEQRYRSV